MKNTIFVQFVIGHFHSYPELQNCPKCTVSYIYLCFFYWGGGANYSLLIDTVSNFSDFINLYSFCIWRKMCKKWVCVSLVTRALWKTVPSLYCCWERWRLFEINLSANRVLCSLKNIHIVLVKCDLWPSLWPLRRSDHGQIRMWIICGTPLSAFASFCCNFLQEKFDREISRVFLCFIHELYPPRN